MRLLPCLLFFISGNCLAQVFESGHGTLMLLFYTNDTIYLSIDSKTSIDRSDKSTSSKLQEKLGNVGAFHFGTSGISYMKEKGVIKFQTKLYINGVLNKNTTLPQAIQYLKSKTPSELEKIFSNHMKEGGMINFDSTITDLFLATFEGGQPRCFAFSYMFKKEKNKVSVLIMKEPQLLSKKELWSTGSRSKFFEYASKTLDWYRNINESPVYELIKMFRYVIPRDSDVGFPVVMHVIYKDGYQKKKFEK